MAAREVGHAVALVDKVVFVDLHLRAVGGPADVLVGFVADEVGQRGLAVGTTGDGAIVGTAYPDATVIGECAGEGDDVTIS